jgi:cbb3-type cytochrome oxidase subunit 3
MNTIKLVAWHMGSLHPIETLLVLLLAFGPFAIAGIVYVIRRRSRATGDAAAEATPDDPSADRRGTSGLPQP